MLQSPGELPRNMINGSATPLVIQIRRRRQSKYYPLKNLANPGRSAVILQNLQFGS
jgi:hypothetical protein